MAAAGHPNVEGAENYSESIISVMNNAWPDWLHPLVLDFSVSPTILPTGESFAINYKVSSNCSEGLKQVELWRKDERSDWQKVKINTLSDENGSLAANLIKSLIAWIQRILLSEETGSVSGSFTDSPPAPGKYWYGVHVVDNAGNWNDEQNANTANRPGDWGPGEVEVIGAQETEIGALIRKLVGHTSSVWSVSFSPDGRKIASGSWDTTVKIWDASSGSLIRTLEGHTSDVRSVAFSPDSKTIASVSLDNTVKVWDASSGSLIRTLEGGGESSVAFSPDGRTIASGSYDTTVKIWDASSGSLIRTLEGATSGVMSVVFSTDGRTIASGGGNIVWIWDASSGSLIRTLEGHTTLVSSIAFSPDGQTILSGSEAIASGEDSAINIWDEPSGSLIRTLEGHGSSVLSVAFSPDGRTIASGEGIVWIMDASSGSLIRTLEDDTSCVMSVAFSPDGRTIASGSYDGTIRLWRAG